MVMYGIVCLADLKQSQTAPAARVNVRAASSEGEWALTRGAVSALPIFDYIVWVMNEYVRLSEAVTRDKSNWSIQRIIVRRTCSVLYMLFNGVCMIVYAYQIYLWIRQGFWTKIPSQVLLTRGLESRVLNLSGTIGGVVHWTLNVELAYTLCVIATIFYVFRWLADRKGKKGI